MIRYSKKLAKVDTAFGTKLSKGDIQETVDQMKKASKKLGPVYGAFYGKGRKKW